MRTNGPHRLHVLFLLACLLTISCAAYAAVPAATQQPKVAPAGPPSACMVTGNCPPHNNLLVF